MAFYYAEMQKCKEEAQAFEDAKAFCASLRAGNEDMIANLSTLAASVVGSVKLEDPEGFQTALSQLNSANEGQIGQIESACDSAIASCWERYDEYDRLNRQELQRIASEMEALLRASMKGVFNV